MEKRLNIKPYNCVNYKLCYHAPLFSALQYWGIDLDIFLSNDIFVYSFHAEDGHVLQCDNIEVIPENDIFERIGLRQHELKEYDEEEIIKALRQGYPVFAPIDRYYWNDKKYNAAVYMRTHKTHYFLIVGYEIQEREFTVIDIFDDGREFDVFYNKIGFEALRQCCEMYRQRFQSIWKLSVLEAGEQNAGLKNQNYQEIMINNLKYYQETMYGSLEKIQKAICFIEQCMNEPAMIADLSRRSTNMYMGMSLKNVQKYETTHFLKESEAAGEAFAELSMLHYRMVSLFRKMHWAQKYEPEQCRKIIEIMRQIYDTEMYAHDEIFALI